MMPALTDLSLDHVGSIVSDLAKGAAAWERLGFTLSPQSRQSGRLPGRDETGPWATANRCAIFERGYLELIGTVDVTAHNPWRAFLNRFEGPHLCALRCGNAAETWRALSARTGNLHAPVERERVLDVAGRLETMRFRNIFSKDEEHPEGRFIIIEHCTPELLWQPPLMVHENGAVALTEAMFAVHDAAPTLRRLEALAGVAPSEPTGGQWRFDLPGGGALRVFDAAHFARQFSYRPGPTPCLAGVTIAFRDRSHAIRLLGMRGVPVACNGQDWYIGPDDANGSIVNIVTAG